jgi:RNA polymerase sigma-70 factor (ECF subfamily)
MCALCGFVTFDGGDAILLVMGERGALVQHYRDVFRFVRRRVESVETAEDVTQEVFAGAAAALSASAAEAPPPLAWLYTVAQRRIVDEARRKARRRTVSLELVEPESSPTVYGEGIHSALAAGLSAMPEGQRRVVVGRLLRGQSFAELAREVGASEEACRMRFMRGLQYLRETFEREGLTP